MHITPDDLSGSEVRALLEEHFSAMLANSPKGSCHFLDFEGLNATGVTFWSIWSSSGEETELAGCGALKEIDSAHGEIKSIRTHQTQLRKGVATQMLEHIIAEARMRGYRRLSLETGTGRAFEPAIAMYRCFGFSECQPFGDYVCDPFSIFMTREI